MPLPVIYFIRHGVTHANVRGLMSGNTETDLTPQGISQAQSSGVFLGQFPILRFFVSDLRRTRQTWQALGLNLPVSFDARLREINFGQLENLPYKEKPKDLNFEALYYHRSLRYPAGDSFLDIQSRLVSFIKDCLEGQPGPVGIVAHGTVGRALLLQTASSCQPQDIFPLELKNGEVLRIADGRFERLFTPDNSPAS